MPNVVTTVPAVLDALVTLGRSVLPAAVDVSFGPVFDIPDEFLVVGFSLDEDEGNVDGTSTDAGNNMADETYTVHCLLSTATGDSEPDAARNRLLRTGQLFTLFAGALRQDPTVGGVLPFAQGGAAKLTRTSWLFGRAENGAYASVEFDIEVTAPYLGAL